MTDEGTAGPMSRAAARSHAIWLEAREEQHKSKENGMNRALKTGRVAAFGAVSAAALLPAATGWLLQRESGRALGEDRERSAPLVPGERQYLPLEFAAAVVAGPNAGLALEGTLFLKNLGTGRLEGILLRPDDTLIPIMGQYSVADDDKQTVRLLAHLSDRGVLDLLGVADFTVLPDSTETLHPTLPRVRLTGFGFMSGPTADDQGVWSFESEGLSARAAVTARSDDVATWGALNGWDPDRDPPAVDELLND